MQTPRVERIIVGSGVEAEAEAQLSRSYGVGGRVGLKLFSAAMTSTGTALAGVTSALRRVRTESLWE